MDGDSALMESAEEKAFFESGGSAPPPPEEKITDPAPEEKPEPKAEEKPAEKAEEKPLKETKVVPLATLLEEREAARALKAELKTRGERMEAMEKRFMQLVERVQAPQAQQSQAPNVDDDPIAVIKALKEREERRDRQESETRERAAFTSRLQAEISGRETAFAKDNTDYHDAISHLGNALGTVFRHMGTPDVELPQTVQGYLASIAQGALNRGQDPARAAYEIAKTMGYAKKTDNATPRAENGQFKAEEKVETIKKGQQASKSLSGAGGDSPAPLTLEALAEMEDDEFDKNWDKVMKAARRK